MRWYTKILLVGNILLWSLVFGLSASAAYFGKNYTNTANTSGFTSTTTGSTILTYAEAVLCRDPDVANGTVSLRVFDDTTDTYLGTSSAVSVSTITYEATVANCADLVSFAFPTYPELTAGHEYQFQYILSTSTVDNVYTPYGNYGGALQGYVNTVATGNFYGDINVSASYATYYDLTEETRDVDIYELPDWDGEVYVGAEGANIPRYIDCFLNQADCQTWVNYTFDQIGQTAYLVPYVSGGDNNWLTGISSSTLEQKLIMREYFTLPTQTTATTTYYCIYIVGELLANDTQLCLTAVYWTDEDDLGLPVYDIESACDDVATSTGDFWDDFRYGIECGIRKVVYWAFTPQPSSVQKFRENYETAKENFPVSVLNDYQATFAAIEEYQGSNLTIPVGEWWDKTSGPDPIATVELSTTTLMGYIDEDFYDDYMLYTKVFIYLIGAFYVLYRILSLNKQQTDVG